jgi:hypothetical protein
MNYIGKYIKIIQYNHKFKIYDKITYGFVTDAYIICDSENITSLIGNFISKNIDEDGKFIDGAYFSDNVYLNKIKDCNREVKEDEYIFFKNNVLKEIKEYEQNIKLL